MTTEQAAPVAATDTAVATEATASVDAPVVDAPEGDAAKTETATVTEGAPESYAFVAPEGREYNPEVITAFSDVMRDLNLPQDKAQAALDKLAPVLEAQHAQMLDKLRTEWATSAKADKEYGGDKFDENLGIAKSALDKFGTPALTEFLNESGLGNHPEVLRLMTRIGKAISQDTIITGNAAPAQAKGAAQTLYPDQK